MTNAKSDIFSSTAEYYARYRPPYPDELLQGIASRFALDGKGRLLDLGCGAGQLAIPLARHFEEVVALDPESQMIAEGKRQAGTSENIRWIAAGSSDLVHLKPELGMFRLATMGNSFHWMDRGAALKTLAEMLDSQGGIAVVGGSPGGNVWADHAGWKPVARAVIQRFLGAERRAGTASTYTDPPEKHEVLIARSAFGHIETFEVESEYAFTVDDIIGLLYSTSYASKALLGEKYQAFENSLRNALLELDPAGRYTECVTYTAILARLR